MSPSVYAVATMDTKGQELAFVAERLRTAGVPAATVDVGTLAAPSVPPDIARTTVIERHPQESVRRALSHPVDRGQAISAMSQALEKFLLEEFEAGRVAGVIGIGGSGGTALVTPAMRALPIGLPKLMVSTVASGNTAPYVGCSDITLMYSVVDVAGLNSVSRRILANAAHAMAGMVKNSLEAEAERPALGLTMFGVTTPCVTAVRQALEARGYDCLVFHATGAGGQAMEKLVEAGLIGGVLDITTTEVADYLVGGVFPCGADRFESILKARVPYVLSTGALDMVNFGAMTTVPEPFRNRKLHVHNAQVTLMRTTPEENRSFARWIASKLNRSVAPLVVLIPERGVSALDAPGQPFHDPEADAALFSELERLVEQTEGRQVRRLPHHINDPEFAQALVKAFLALMGKVVVTVRIENLEDLFDAEKGLISPDAVRSVEVHDALVDTGATGLLLPKSLIASLGLRPLRIRQARGLGGTVPMPTYRAVRLTIQGRDCAIDVGEIGDEFPVLIGQVPLELLDWVVDPNGQRLIGNPEHGGEQIMEVF